MSIEVKRSPAKICWWVCVNGVIVNTYDRKYDANSYASSLRKEYGL